MKNKGQIKLDSSMGKWIFQLAKSPEVKSIVEVGTWWGMGSTYCIKQGLLKRENPIREGYSIECMRERYDEACKNLEPLPTNFFLLYGSVISTDEMRELMTHIKEGEHQEWAKQDYVAIKKAPHIGNPMEGLKIDLCVLDGGAFSGMLDFYKIGIYSKYLVLDDTMDTKHRMTRSYIIEHKDWDVLEDETQERNGYLVAKNKKV